ncbi:MAG: AAA family ATPase [Deltaproteobacteria bacterium]|nr:AAA family ATPase [Deltaproteobacteria bacterium]MBP6830804.1 AAA family ATPase [Deltaproteobacteria bacterium]
MNDPAPTGLRPEVLIQAQALTRTVLDEVARAYVGNPEIPERILVAMLARGHCLLEGVPGVAKTTLIKAFAAAMGGAFKRIQFTPDLLPSDITGTYVLSPREGTFSLRRGPIFAHVVLGDEINRAPAKTQSALLEAMQERQVTIDGETHPLAEPFFVLATQNPLEQEGTYPLPEAQVDRFLLRVVVPYPSAEDEVRVLRAYSAKPPITQGVISLENILWLQSVAEAVHVEEEIYTYAVALAGYTRTHPKVALGASPRASLGLVLASRAVALIDGRGYVLPDDVKKVAQAVMAHRILLGAEAESEGASPAALVDEALARVPYRRLDARDGAAQHGRAVSGR